MSGSARVMDARGDANQGPDFIGIGAEKAGSTWLSDHLRKHRQIAALPLKELNYFNAIDIGAATGVVAQLCGNHWINRMWRHAFRHHFLADLRRRDVSE